VTPAAVLLAEVRRHGAVAYRVDNRIRLRPATAIPPDLLERLRQHKAELLALVPDYDAIHAEITTDVGTAEDAAALERYALLNGPGIYEQIHTLQRQCDDLVRAGANETTYRQAVTALVTRVRQVRQLYREARHMAEADPPSWIPNAAATWRVVIEKNRPLQGPIQLDCCTTITNPLLYTERTLVDLELAVAHRNAGRETAFTTLIDEYVERLAACGCRVRVETVT
jgi:hypothetical protein